MSPSKSNNQDFYSRNVTVHTRQKEAGSSVFYFPSQNGTGWESGRYNSLGRTVPLPRSLNERLLPIMDSWTKAEGREERAKSGKGLSHGGEKCLKNDIIHAKLLHNKKHIDSKNILYHLINSYFHYEIFKIQWKGEC